LVKTWSQKAFQAVAVRISENAVLRIGHAYSSVETFLFCEEDEQLGVVFHEDVLDHRQDVHRRQGEVLEPELTPIH
jgi:hypothetical protein